MRKPRFDSLEADAHGRGKCRVGDRIVIRSQPNYPCLVLQARRKLAPEEVGDAHDLVSTWQVSPILEAPHQVGVNSFSGRPPSSRTHSVIDCNLQTG